MQDFIYHNPVKILFGHDQIPALAQEVPQDKKVMIVYGGGSVIKHGILQRVKGSLKNTLVFEFGGVEPNPHYETLMKAVEIVKAESTFLNLTYSLPGNAHFLSNFSQCVWLIIYT
ncbi:hypothetical protein NUKP41_38220 [Klebsiella variicola]|uniref:iron-containing alcohol dehydrogenase n=1 Tax=Klebsiella variicola TaxID=244366 RepID=UPI002181D43E|nr:iron-containing alcohol dehydrogenase [Klebsiella variicola]GKK77647.1 hypothetical protein NUKP41_38220 [Klebsiella variicola]HCI9085187.1 iron-containing alcohol dehydrogenase [Klebsiella variicola]